MLIRRARLGEEHADLRVIDATITAIAADGLPADPGEEILEGGRITGAFAEPHVHLDAALLGERAPNRSGTLREGIANWTRLRDGLTAADVKARAKQTIDMYRAHGCLRIRTHVDTGNLTSVAALLELRDEVDAELQVVAFPQEGILRAKGNREMWEEAVAMGCDAVGGIPHFERTTEEGWESVRMVFDLAEKHDRMVDFHCDETDDPGSRNLEVVCAQAIDRGFSDRVVAGHCTALHSYEAPYAAKVIDLVALSGVQVIANPLDNVVLQGRYDGYPRRRGITPVDDLWAAGAQVGIGHDSVMDPWYRLGTANLLDAAYMLVHVAQLTSEAEMIRVFDTLIGANHLPFGGAGELGVGSTGFLWWEDADPIEILRKRPTPRLFA